MNITGYKQKLKTIKFLLSKTDKNSFAENKLEEVKRDCNKRIKSLQKELDDKRSKLVRKTVKGRKKKGRRKMFMKKKKL